MTLILQNLWLIPARSVQAAGLRAPPVSAGAERRQKVAHGMSRGFDDGNGISPGGAKEAAFAPRTKAPGGFRLVVRLAGWLSVAPAGARFVFGPIPTAGAVGYRLSPLRGWPLVAIRRTLMIWRVQNPWLFSALPVLAAGPYQGSECRQRTAHGVSRGLDDRNATSPGGA